MSHLATAPIAVHASLFDLNEQADPAEEPVLLTEAKEWLRVEDTADDNLIQALIVDARIASEGYTRRYFVSRAITVRLTQVPVGSTPIYLPYPKASDLTAVTYEDSNGDAQVIDVGASLTVESLFGIVRPNPGFTWPAARSMNFAYTAGYGPSADDVPEPIKTAVKCEVAQSYEVRTNQVVGTIVSGLQSRAAKRLLDRFKAHQF